MQYNIVTSVNEYYWNEVAHKTLLELDKNWISNGKIFVYHELKQELVDTIKNNFSSRVIWLNLYKIVPELPAWIEKWKDHPKANGYGTGAWRDHAIKWAHKTFAYIHQCLEQKKDWVIWLDCDALLFKPIDNKFLKSICDDSKAVAYIGRKGNYSECGFLAFNLNQPVGLEFINELKNLYDSGKFTKISETHDSFLFDAVRKEKFTSREDMFDDLNAYSKTDKNPFGHSRIGTHFWHGKGANKAGTLAKAKIRR